MEVAIFVLPSPIIASLSLSSLAKFNPGDLKYWQPRARFGSSYTKVLAAFFPIHFYLFGGELDIED